MPTYDVVAGFDNATFNTEISKFYTAVYPNVFKGEINVGEVGIASIIFDLQAAPTASLTPSAAIRVLIERTLDDPSATNEFAAAPAEQRDAIVAAATAATFDVAADSIALTVVMTDGKQDPTTGSLSVGVSVSTGTTSSGANYLTLQALTATVSIPSNPLLADLLNNPDVMSKYILPAVNSALSPFTIPALSYSSLTLSMPVPAVQSGYLLAFAALGTTQPDVPAPSSWPSGTVFIGTDPAALVAAANTELPISKNTSFGWGPFDGGASTSVGPIGDGGISVNADGSLTVVLPCQASAGLTIHTPEPFPNVNIDPSASATITATASACVVNGELEISVVSFGQPSFSFDWGIPSWIAWFVDPFLDGLGDALGAVIAPLISDLLSGKTFSVTSIPSVNITISGASYSLSLANATTAAWSGPNGPLLLVEGEPTFAPTGTGTPLAAV
jgi:hypothetical protein